MATPTSPSGCNLRRARDQRDGRRPADVFVSFGITGDLAKVMTFRSLYRLEKRGLLDCPSSAWRSTTGRPTTCASTPVRRSRLRASRSTRPSSSASRARLSYVQGDFADAATFERLAAAIERRAQPVFYLEIPPFLFGDRRRGPCRGRPDRERARGGGEAVRARPRVRSRAQRPRCTSTSTSPSSTGSTTSWGRWGWRDPLPAVREHDVRADLEPQLRLVRADHHGRGLRRRGPRPLLRPGRRAARRRGQPPDAGRRRGRHGAPRRRRPETLKDAPARVFRAMPHADPAHYVRGQYEGYREIDGVAPDSSTETYAALRLEIDNWRWSGVPFFIRTGKRLPVTQTELRLVFKRPPRLGFRAARTHARARPARRQARPDDGHPAADRGPARRTAAEPEQITWTWSSRERGRRGPDPVRGAAARGHASATARASPGRTASRRPGGSCSRCSTTRRRSTRTRRDPGARPPPTIWSPATAAGTGRGWRR